MFDLYQILNNLDIKYEKFDHPAVFTCDESDKFVCDEAAKCKNLFLRNKKGDKHYLIICLSEKKIDIKELTKKIDTDRLSFASDERLDKYLGLKSGSVSPFGLINDKKKEVEVVVDKDLLSYQKLGFHPNINTATLVINLDDFKKFLDWTGNKISYVSI